MKVSIIIPTYNRSQLLDWTLNSILNQTISTTKFEVIVSDDGSNDSSFNVIKKYLDKMELRYIYQRDDGYRPGKARNNAISVSDGDICLMIDSGVLLEPSCLEEHFLFHERHLKSVAIGYVYGFEENNDLSQKLKRIIDPMNVGETVKKLSLDPSFFDVRDSHYVKYQDNLSNLPAPWYYFWTCHVSVPKSELNRAGLFDKYYDGRWGVEDTDLGFRLFRNGLNFSLLRAAQSIHYPHSKNKMQKHSEGYQNCLHFHEKHNTLETQLFLEYFMSEELVDINKLVPVPQA